MDIAAGDGEREFLAELSLWLDEHPHRAPAFTSLHEEIDWGRSWQATMAADRWVGIHWPRAFGGRDATPIQLALYLGECARRQVPQPVNRVGINLVGPTLLAHGSREQCLRWMPPILTAEEIWCQLFSEPDAGSDLGALTTRARSVGDGYLVSGQKVWTSYAQFARWGLCVARTGADDPDAPRQFSMLAIDMTSPGIEIRPLVQLTGDAEFNEVFLDEVFVPEAQRIGEEGQGWSVASSTLAHERGTNFPVKEEAVHEAYFLRLWETAAANGALDDPLVADGLVASYIELAILRLHNARTLTRLARGEEPGPESSLVKLAWSEMTQHLSTVALSVTGRSTTSALAGPWARQWLWSKAASIAGGTSQVQRDIIAGRILRLPR